MKKWFGILALCWVITACNKDSDFESFNSGNFNVTFTTVKPFIADDSSKMVVHIQAVGSMNGDAVTATFSATAGTLLRTDATNKVYLENDTASFTIQAGGTPGNYLLGLEFNTNVRSFQQKSITMGTSYPDTIYVDASKSFLDTTAATTFTTTLQKKHGKVSTTVGISAIAYQLVNGKQVTVGRFTGLNPNHINASSQVVLTYYCDTRDFVYTSPVYFVFSSKDDAGATIQSSLVIAFKY